jgi:hypothetical protein
MRGLAYLNFIFPRIGTLADRSHHAKKQVHQHPAEIMLPLLDSQSEM